MAVTRLCGAPSSTGQQHEGGWEATHAAHAFAPERRNHSQLANLFSMRRARTPHRALNISTPDPSSMLRVTTLSPNPPRMARQHGFDSER
jgi:hypothetical protein